MTYGDFKDLNKRKAADKVLHDKAFNMTKKKKHDGQFKKASERAATFWHLEINLELKMKIVIIRNQQKNYTNQLLENLVKEK